MIGTHRLAQHDVTFQNLGLLIIDEEQRFGVEVKERLKALRQIIDVMTMTATPIPPRCTCRCWECATSRIWKRRRPIAWRWNPRHAV